MRDGDWKVLAKLNIKKHTTVNSRNAEQIKAATLSDFQIFKVTEDIPESRDLSASHPEKLAELKQRLKTHYRELVNGSHVWKIEE
jgi:arylsulfatase A